jgi:hypothetical protein
MTKPLFYRYGVAAISLVVLHLCSCSRISESTGLGSGIIDSVNPGKVDINSHFHAFSLDSNFFKGSFSLPFAGDTGFGYHNTTNGEMIIGNANSEHSVGYLEVIITRDTSYTTQFFQKDKDTLESLKLVLSCDSFPVQEQFDIYAVSNQQNALAHPDLRKLGRINFPSGNPDSALYDTLSIGLDTAHGFYRHYCDSVLSICDTFIPTADTFQRQDTLRFAIVNSLANSASDTVRLRGACSFILSGRRPGDTSLRVQTFSSFRAGYIAAEDNLTDTLRKQPITSFASKRTAVYRYKADSLWRAMGARGNLLSAGFVIPNKTTDSAFNFQCIARADTIHNGTLLDSLFNADSKNVLSILRDSSGFAPVTIGLQELYNSGQKPPYVYLYVRNTNSTSLWTTDTMNIKPVFKAMITNP